MNHNYDSGPNDVIIDDVSVTNPSMGQGFAPLTLKIANVDNPDIVVQGECHAYNAMHFDGVKLQDGTDSGTIYFGAGNDCLRNDMDFSSATATLRRTTNSPSYAETPLGQCNYEEGKQNCRLVQVTSSAPCPNCNGPWQLESQHFLDLRFPYVFLQPPLGCEYISPVRRDAIQCDVISNMTNP